MGHLGLSEGYTEGVSRPSQFSASMLLFRASRKSPSSLKCSAISMGC